jgi:GH15 family glucan-1,4-alpha-glucosidase
MKAWNHHLTENIEKMINVGSTIFTDYDTMINTLAQDGREWLITEIEVKENELAQDMFCSGMATILVNKKVKSTFSLEVCKQ